MPAVKFRLNAKLWQGFKYVLTQPEITGYTSNRRCELILPHALDTCTKQVFQFNLKAVWFLPPLRVMSFWPDLHFR